MEHIDLPYIVRSLGTLSGVPVRLYQGGNRCTPAFPSGCRTTR